MRRKLLLGLMIALGVGVCFGEAVCFRTVAGAAAQTGLRGEDGFRLEGSGQDAFSGKRWAMVKSCMHPEWPAVMVPGSRVGTVRAQMEREGFRLAEVKRVVNARLVMLAGARVKVVRIDATMRLELAGMAQGNGAVGDRVRVRILCTNGLEDGSAEERFLVGIVRSAELLELER